ncbi:MAG: DUF1905 domain-containing protein [Anaerolineales bacterium]|nr:DUF1905 domain-containing protein [Anaerolineales bacterium]
MMSKKIKFRAVIEDAGGGGAYVTIPFEVEKVFKKKRVKVKATIAGEPYRGSLVRMGGDYHILGVRKDIRERIGKTFGEEIEVEIEEDTEPRAGTIPEDVSQALKSNPDLETYFRGLSYTHQKEYIQWIQEAKRAETRQRRVIKMLELIKQGKK